MSTEWEVVPGYDNSTFSDDLIFEVDHKTKEIEPITEQVMVSGEDSSQFIRFVMPRYYDGVDLSEKSIQIIYLSAEESSDINAARCVERNDEQIRFGWLVPAAACYEVGTLSFSIEVVGEDYVWKTKTYDIEVFDGLNGGEVIPEPAEKTWYIELQERCDHVLKNAEAWAVGQRGGVDVDETDVTYHNNSKYYAEKAAEDKAITGTYASGARQSELQAASSASKTNVDRAAVQELAAAVYAAKEESAQLVEEAKNVFSYEGDVQYVVNEDGSISEYWTISE